MNDEYYRFRIGDEPSNNLFKTTVKILTILILLLLLIVLAVFSYKYLTKDSKITTKTYQQPVQKQLQISKSTALKKEDIALIVKSVMLQIKAQQAKTPLQNIQNKTTDQQLLTSLQNADVDTISKRKVTTIKPKAITKKIKKIAKKRYKTYNAVIINKHEITNTSDLARLYASINKIARKNKKRVLNSAYTKRIRKEIGTRRNSMRTIKVRKGDTLGSLAMRAYGDAKYYKKIFRANPDLVNNPNKISIGQILRVPR